MAGEGRRLCDPRPGRRVDPVCVGLLFECRRAADLRDRATARRPRIPLVLRRELLISAGPGEWRAAWVEDGAAVELYVERGDSSPPGSIFVGRVLRLLPGLDAALVDIGAERPGFLPLRQGDTRPDEGARVTVQLRREEQQDKGGLLSMRIARLGGGPELEPLLAEAVRLDPPAQLYPDGGL